MRKLYVLLAAVGLVVFPFLAHATPDTHKEFFLESERFSIPKTWTSADTGKTYRLDSIGSVETSSSEEPSKLFTRSSSPISISKEDEAALDGATLKTRFPASYEIDEEGYVGAIPLKTVVSKPTTEMTKHQVDKYEVFTTAENNAEALLKEKLFKTASGDSLFTRIAVSFEPVQGDSDLPSGGSSNAATYKATVLYRGFEEEPVIVSYEVQGVYEGSVALSASNRKIVATYVEEEATSFGGSLRTTSVDGSQGLVKQVIKTLVMPFALLLGAGVLVAFCYFTFFNAQIFARSRYGMRRLGGLRVQKTKSGYRARVPFWKQLPKKITSEEKIVVRVRGSLGLSRESLQIFWRGIVLFDGLLGRWIVLEGLQSISGANSNKSSFRQRRLSLAIGAFVFVVLVFVTSVVVRREGIVL